MYGLLQVGVLIPALDEEAAIGRVLRAIPSWVDDVVVADNGSSDRTAEVARSLGARVVHEPRRGYGQACLSGLTALRHVDVVVFLDADASDDPQEMCNLLEPINRGSVDLVIGSRVLGNREPGALTPQQRFGNELACRLIASLYGFRFSDLGPFRAIRRSALDRLRMDDRDFGWTVQMQIRAVKRGLRVLEVPVSYRRRIGRSKISGTVRGVISAGSKILYTTFREAFDRPPAANGLRNEKVKPTAMLGDAGRSDISVIIPALDEQEHIGQAIGSAMADSNVQVIVVDGGSRDATVDVARRRGATVIRGGGGRGRQMNCGAAAADGKVLLFLHADSCLPEGFSSHVRAVLATPGTIGGAFALQIDPAGPTMRLHAASSNFRSRSLGLPYGDQAIFLTRYAFELIGGYAEIPIMEDFDLVRRLQRLGRIRIANAPVRTSGRRWQRYGRWRMSLINQLVLLAYLAGAKPALLHRWRESGKVFPPAALLCSKTTSISAAAEKYARLCRTLE